MPSSDPTSSRPVRIAIIGQTQIRPDESLDRSGALALALRQIPGIEVTLRAIAANADAHSAIDMPLAASGVTSQVSTRDDGDPAPIRLGDTLDIWGLFAHDLVILDADDAPLRAFLTDLPAHTAPGVRMLGTLDYVHNALSPREQDIALRFDAIVGSVAQAKRLFTLPTADTLSSATSAIGAMMRGANLRTVALHDGSLLSIVARDEPPVAISVPNATTTAQVTAAFAVTMARRAGWTEVADFLIPPPGS